MRINTMAKEVHGKFEELGVYPWQYQDYKLISLNYNVVISDIETYWKTEARFREGFKVDNDNQEIYVPNFFTKINGIHHHAKEYKEFVLMLKSAKNTVVINDEKIFEYEDISAKKSSDRKLCTTKKEADDRDREDDFCELTIKNLLEKKFFIYRLKDSTFDELTSAKQNAIFELIQRVIEQNKSKWTEEDMLRFINCCMNIPKSIIVTYNNFDYNFDVPKILYMSDSFRESTAMYLWILNELGFDIILLEPSGRNTIEKYCEINSLNLGYFVDSFDFSKVKTDEEIRKEEEKKKKEKERQKKKKKEEFFDNFSDNLGDLLETIGEKIFPFLWYVATIALPFASIVLWINFSGLTMLAVCVVWGLIVLFAGMFLGDCDAFDDDDAAMAVITICLVVTVVILCSRGVWTLVNDPDVSRSTHTHDGFCEIADELEETESGFVLHYRKDAVGQDGYHSAYAYIENNAQNTSNMYFIVKYGNKVLYESSKIEPMEYCPKFSFDQSVDMPIGDHELLIEFYVYNEELKGLDRYTGELIGTGIIKYHVFDTNKEVKAYKEENDFDYCSD